MKNENIPFQFETCNLCGQIMEFSNLDMRNILEDHGFVKFNFCPSCGAKVDTKSFTQEDITIWRSLATRWIIRRRLERKRLMNGFKAE